MVPFFAASLLICSSFATTPLSLVKDAVRTHSNSHSKVMLTCEKYLGFVQALVDKREISETDTARILDAMVFSAEKHQYQKRKDPQGTPYIIHPIGVSYTLAHLGQVRDADVLIGALLHDTVEDTDTTFEEISARFGLKVEGYVREVTDDKSLSKEERKRLQIADAHHKSSGAALIKLSDKLYNLTDLSQNPPTDWPQKRIDEYFLWAQQVVDQLPPVNSQLKQAVDEVINSYLERLE